MGEIVEFPSNGSTAQGYLAVPDGGTGIPVVVIQEWWGLVPHIEDVCDRFAAEGFVALAPDLFHGQKASEPDEAGKLMMALNIDEAAKDMSGAVDKVADVAAQPQPQFDVALDDVGQLPTGPSVKPACRGRSRASRASTPPPRRGGTPPAGCR